VNEQPFELGDWRVDPPRGLLTPLSGGEPVRIEPQLMDLLLLFAGSGGRVLAKDEIVDAVWSGRAIGDDTLAAAISRLRAALGAREAIETLPKRGYRLAIDAPERAPPRADAPDEARDLAAKGAAALALPGPFSLSQARLYFEAAVKAAPGYARAHAGLAETLTSIHLGAPDAGLLAAARSAATAAVGLDENLAEAWAALGAATLLQDRAFAPADEALRRALALDPGNAAAHRHRALALCAVGRFAEAEREIRDAVALEPVSLAARGSLLQVLIAARRYGPAVAEATKAMALSPTASDAWYARGWAKVFSGDEAGGVADLLEGLRLWGVDRDRIAALAGLASAEGFAALCREAADLFETQTVMFRPRDTDVAMLRALGGQADEAFALLESATARDDPFLVMIPWLPQLDPLRLDVRWASLTAKVRLVR
jgi:DNA-binding winged helix-turn-helix (wHTH) protein/Flp pilus assembly protein TadD